jgi:hypothetical protein
VEKVRFFLEMSFFGELKIWQMRSKGRIFEILINVLSKSRRSKRSERGSMKG